MIRNIIFDLGGVVLNIDYHLTSKAFQQLGIRNFDEIFSQAQQSTLFDDLETGKISPATFRTEVRNITGLNLSNEAIDDAWNAMLLDLPAERIDILRACKANYRTFLLSNTNAIHLKAYTRDLQNAHQVSGLEELFEKEYYSHTLGLRKPHPETFTAVCKAQGLKPEETVFIDDSYQHIEGAKQAGLHTLFMDREKGMTLPDLFEDGKLKEGITYE